MSYNVGYIIYLQAIVEKWVVPAIQIFWKVDPFHWCPSQEECPRAILQ
jgi:hypothetical protein